MGDVSVNIRFCRYLCNDARHRVIMPDIAGSANCWLVRFL